MTPGSFLATSIAKGQEVAMKEAYGKSCTVSSRFLPVQEPSCRITCPCVRTHIQGAGHPSSTHVNTHSFPADYKHPKAYC